MMNITREEVSYFAELWGLIFLVTLFVGTVTFALWPNNRDKFKEAAHRPLDDD